MWRRSGELGILLLESSKRGLVLFKPNDLPLKYLWKSRWTSPSFLFLEVMRVFPPFPSWSSDSSGTCRPSRKSQIWKREMSKRATEKVNRISRQPIQKTKNEDQEEERECFYEEKNERESFSFLIWQERSEIVIFRHETTPYLSSSL